MILITPSTFLIGQVSAMWPMRSFHSPHLLQPHLDFKILYSPTLPKISLNRAPLRSAIASPTSVWDVESAFTTSDAAADSVA